jgi:pilus assembly protein CpaE
LAVNLASYLSTSARRRVALLDLDLFSETTSLLLNTVPNGALCEALDNPERVDSKFLERAMLQVSERLDVLASDGEKIPVNGLTAAGVRLVMEHLQSLYHYTVVDIPTSIASAHPEVLAGADTVFVVCDGALASARNAARLIRVLTPSCPMVHTVLNRAGAPGQISMAEVEKVLGRRPDLTVPFLPKHFANAAILGTPATSGSNRVKTAIGRLAREVSGQEASKPSLLDRVLRR